MPLPRAALLRFYDAERRELPWRATRDPYAIWVSEVMLQQTRVETVIPYFERFIARFPSAEALAGASEDEVMAEWSGLGYYRRARQLHAGAREVLERYGGQLPEAAEARRALPGIGRYTAGAIGSIAFDLPEPIVDGNVARVLCRYHAIDTPLGKAETERRLWSEAERLVQGPRPGDLNQALMELGATICTPQGARCGSCPIAPGCQARRGDRVGELPTPRQRKAPAEQRWAAVVATSDRGREIWLERSTTALFGGLWGLPMRPRALGSDGALEAREALREAGLRARFGPDQPRELRHLLTHRVLLVQVRRATATRGVSSDRLRPFTREALAEVGVSALTLRLIEVVA